MVGDLPSSEHAKEFFAHPSPSGALTLGFDLVGRALIIYAGMKLFGNGSRSTLRSALAGSAAIELFVVGLVLAKKA